jgi:hypothetical protein
MSALHPTTSDLNNEINKALHTMTAHLHRYGSELGWLEDIIAGISDHHSVFMEESNHDLDQTKAARERITLGIAQTASQLKAVNSFRTELESKTRNILALVRQNLSNRLVENKTEN